MPISEKIDFGIYHNGLDLKLKSEAINVDFHRISLKKHQRSSIANSTIKMNAIKEMYHYKNKKRCLQ